MSEVLRMPLNVLLLLYTSISLAFSQIWANKLRGFLTTLGILIGVAAVSAVIALIAGMKDRVLSEFEAFGTNKLFIHPQWRKKDRGNYAWYKMVFKNDDFDELLEFCPSVESFTRDAGYGGMMVGAGSKVSENRVNFRGIDPEWHMIERRGALMGRPMSLIDSQQSRHVALINTKLRDDLQLDRDPTGQYIDVAYFGRMLIIGLLDQPVASGGGTERGQVVVPFTYTTHRYNWPTWYGVTAMTKSKDNVDEAKAEVEFYLRQKRRLKPGEEDNFQVQTAGRAIDEINQMAGVVTIVAGGIVAVSLLVGGVGIMNIMLVSVSERTREIGLRKAVGAKPSAILMQFLVEAVVLCLLGGALGLVLGQGITSTVASFIPENPNAWDLDPGRDDSRRKPSKVGLKIILPPSAIAVAFGFSVTVGLVFGIFPAIKAASLDPIDALRHE